MLCLFVCIVPISKINVKGFIYEKWFLQNSEICLIKYNIKGFVNEQIRLFLQKHELVCSQECIYTYLSILNVCVAVILI